MSIVTDDTTVDAIEQNHAFCARMLLVHAENPPDAAFANAIENYWRPKFASQYDVRRKVEEQAAKRKAKVDRIKAQIRMDEARLIANKAKDISEIGKLRKKYLDGLSAEVAADHGLTQPELLSKIHRRQWSLARQEFCYRAAMEGALSTPAIGKYMKRDHSTILYAIEQYRNACSQA